MYCWNDRDSTWQLQYLWLNDTHTCMFVNLFEKCSDVNHSSNMKCSSTFCVYLIYLLPVGHCPSPPTPCHPEEGHQWTCGWTMSHTPAGLCFTHLYCHPGPSSEALSWWTGAPGCRGRHHHREVPDVQRGYPSTDIRPVAPYGLQVGCIWLELYEMATCIYVCVMTICTYD